MCGVKILMVPLAGAQCRQTRHTNVRYTPKLTAKHRVRHGVFRQQGVHRGAPQAVHIQQPQRPHSLNRKNVPVAATNGARILMARVAGAHTAAAQLVRHIPKQIAQHSQENGVNMHHQRLLDRIQRQV